MLFALPTPFCPTRSLLEQHIATWSAPAPGDACIKTLHKYLGTVRDHQGCSTGYYMHIQSVGNHPAWFDALFRGRDAHGGMAFLRTVTSIPLYRRYNPATITFKSTARYRGAARLKKGFPMHGHPDAQPPLSRPVVTSIRHIVSMQVDTIAVPTPLRIGTADHVRAFPVKRPPSNDSSTVMHHDTGPKNPSSSSSNSRQTPFASGTPSLERLLSISAPVSPGRGSSHTSAGTQQYTAQIRIISTIQQTSFACLTHRSTNNRLRRR